MNMWKILVLAGLLSVAACSKSEDKSSTPDPRSGQVSTPDSSSPNSNTQPPSVEVPQTDNPNDTASNIPVESDQLTYLKKTKRIWINLQGDLTLSNGSDANALTWSNIDQSKLSDIQWTGSSFTVDLQANNKGTNLTVQIKGKVAEDGASLIEIQASLLSTIQTPNETWVTSSFLDIQNFPIRTWPNGGKSNLGASLSGHQIQQFFKNIDHHVVKKSTSGKTEQINLTQIDFKSVTLTIFFGE